MECNEMISKLNTILVRDIFDHYWADSRIPIVGGLELTFACNMRCVHCYAESGRNYKQLSFESIKNIIDQLAEEGTFLLSLTGGEPLIRDDFAQIYKYVRKKGIMVEVLTNATLINDQHVELFHEYPPIKLDISMYGYREETYEKTTRVKGSYRKFMEGIQKLEKNKIPFDLKTVILNTNKNEIFLMKDFAENIGVNFRYSFNISPMMDGDQSSIEYRISPEEAIQFDLKDEGRRFFWSQMKSKPPLNVQPINDSGEYPVFFCKAGKNTFHIDATGKLFACSRERCHGYDLLKGSFHEGWHKHIVSEVRNRPASVDYPCIHCEYYKYCHHCPADFELENKDPSIPTDFRCKIAKMRAEIFEKPSNVI